ncbi:MAG: hypothetical protein N2376_03855 [Clostridia bacterium]|nr:hypothetical protein [Clostridia bacterium]
MSVSKDMEKHLDSIDVKRKAVKLVIAHLKKKVSKEYMGIEYLIDWLEEMEDILKKEDFDIKEYHRMRKQLNSVIESTLDEEMRDKLRNSWYSFGKALDKKAEPV